MLSRRLLWCDLWIRKFPLHGRTLVHRVHGVEVALELLLNHEVQSMSVQTEHKIFWLNFISNRSLKITCSIECAFPFIDRFRLLELFIFGKWNRIEICTFLLTQAGVDRKILAGHMALACFDSQIHFEKRIDSWSQSYTLVVQIIILV